MLFRCCVEFVNHPPLRPLQLVLVRLLHVVVAHFLEACEALTNILSLLKSSRSSLSLSF